MAFVGNFQGIATLWAKVIGVYLRASAADI
jgi:hypothetical protein